MSMIVNWNRTMPPNVEILTCWNISRCSSSSFKKILAISTYAEPFNLKPKGASLVMPHTRIADNATKIAAASGERTESWRNSTERIPYMYDRETVQRTLDALEKGMACAEAAGVSSRSVQRWSRGQVLHARGALRTVELSRSQIDDAVRRHLDGELANQVATDLGVSGQAGRNWARAARGEGAGQVTEDEAHRRAEMRSVDGLPDDPKQLKAMVFELQSQTDLAREMLEIVKKGSSAEAAELTSAEKMQLARRLRPAYSLTFLTHRLGLPASAYHYQRRLADEGRDPDVDIRDEVVALFERSGHMWGCRCIHASLKPQEGGKRPSEKRVRRMMAKEWLEVSYDREADEPDADKVLNVLLGDDNKHDFSAPTPNVLWVSDAVKFVLPDDPRKVYLSPVLDCFDGSVVGWRADLHASAAVTDPSLKNACQKLRPGDAPTVHTDRDAQYHAASWKIVCSSHGLPTSMSRKGRSPRQRPHGRLLRDDEIREVLLEGLVRLDREGLHCAGRPLDGGVQRVHKEAVAGLEDAHGVPEGCA